MLINEDYLDKITDADINDADSVTIEDNSINPERYHCCIAFQLQRKSDHLEYEKSKQMLDTLLSNYLDDYSITVLPYPTAEKLCGTVFSYENALDKNFGTTDKASEVFIQFNSDNISNMFVIQLSSFFVNAFKNIGNYRNFGSMIPRLFRERNGQYQLPSEAGSEEISLYYLHKAWGLRIYDGMKLAAELLRGSGKNKQALNNFILYVRTTLDDVDISKDPSIYYEDVDDFCKRLRKKMKNRK